MESSAEDTPIQVFVHLAYGFDSIIWQRRWRTGELLGINEEFPYGYFRAIDYGCQVTYSTDTPETKPAKLLRLGLRGVLGFDIVHAWRNRRGIQACDVIWTHTESQSLAVLLLLRLYRGPNVPKVIAQCVWLFDRWAGMSAARRWLYSRLLSHADIITVHSPANLRIVKMLFPKVTSDLMLFGINTDIMLPPRYSVTRSPLRIIALGNDEHRDWMTLIDAAGQLASSCELRIASQKIDHKLVQNRSNIIILKIQNNNDILDLYNWGDFLVLPCRPNFHASGITVIQEALLRGIPVICSDTGGLRGYFSDEEVRYVPPQDPVALRHAIVDLAASADECRAMVRRAQARMQRAGLSSTSYARRHAEISRALLRSRRSQIVSQGA